MARTKSSKLGKSRQSGKKNVPIKKKISRLIVYFHDKEKNGGAHFSAIDLKGIRFDNGSEPSFSLTDELSKESRNTDLSAKFRHGYFNCSIFARIEEGTSFSLFF